MKREMSPFSKVNARNVPAAAFVVAAGAVAAIVAGGDVARAQEAPPARTEPAETVRDQVERLLGDFMSDSESARARAEREMVALGEPGRAELDRLTRDADPKKAISALKLLQSPLWERSAQRERDAKRDPVFPGPRLPEIDLRKFEDDFQRQMEDLRRSLDDWRRQFDTDDWMPGFETRGGTPPKDGTSGASRGASQGQVIENDRSFAWSIDDAGKVKVTVREGKDSAEQVYEAPSLAELRKQHPDVAKRLDGFLPSGGLRRWTLVWPPRASWDSPEKDAAGETSPRDPGLRDGEQRLAPERRDGGAVAPGPVLGIAWGDVPDVLRDQLDLPSGGLVVQTVAPDSIAARLGLRRNDVLVKLAGTDVATAADVRRALESVAEGAPLAAEILRKGRRETLSAKR